MKGSENEKRRGRKEWTRKKGLRERENEGRETDGSGEGGSGDRKGRSEERREGELRNDDLLNSWCGHRPTSVRCVACETHEQFSTDSGLICEIDNSPTFRQTCTPIRIRIWRA